jgi:hypothetical protein
LRLGAVDDHSFKAMPRDPPDRIIHPLAMYDFDFEIAQDAAQNTYRLFIRAH